MMNLSPRVNCTSQFRLKSRPVRKHKLIALYLGLGEHVFVCGCCCNRHLVKDGGFILLFLHCVCSIGSSLYMNCVCWVLTRFVSLSQHFLYGLFHVKSANKLDMSVFFKLFFTIILTKRIFMLILISI